MIHRGVHFCGDVSGLPLVSRVRRFWHNATMFMRSIWSILVLACSSSLVFGCSPPSQEETTYREACRDLEARLKVLERSKLAAEVAAASAKLLPENPGQQWIRIDDWAISRVEIRYFRHWNDKARYEQEDGAIQTALSTIRGYDEALEARGVHLVVVMIPARLDSNPSHLPGVKLPSKFEGANAGLARFLLELNQSGVDAVDLGPAFGKAIGARNEDELYLAYDSHWTPRAVALAAEVVEEHLCKEVGIQRGSDKPGRDFVLKREEGEYLVPPAMPALLPVAEKPIQLRFDRVLKRDGTPAYEQDRTSPILVLGDSYSCYYRDEACDFSSRLQAGMRRKLDTIAMRAGASQTVWKNIRRRKDDLQGKQVVVWMLGTGLVTAGEVIPVNAFPK